MSTTLLIIIMLGLALALIGLSAYIAAKLPDEKSRCPFCDGLLFKGKDGRPVCDCDEYKHVLNLNYCKKHDKIHTGHSCPRCNGHDIWCD